MRGVSMMVPCACQKLSTSGSAMKMKSLAVPAMRAAHQMRRWSRPRAFAWKRATRAEVMKRSSPSMKLGRFAHCVSGLATW